MPYSRQPYTFDRVVRLIIAAAILAGIIWLINELRNVLLPFCVACLIAYILEPFVQYNKELLKFKSRTPAIFVTLFEVVFIVSLLCYFFIPMLIDEMHQMAGILRKYANTNAAVTFMPDEIHQFIRRNVDFNEISDLLTKQEWASLIDNTLRASWKILNGSISVVLGIASWCVVVLYLIFVMIDYERLNEGMKRMVPPKYRSVVFRIGKDIKDSMNHYFRGQSLVALIVGVLFSIGFLIIGLPMAVALGLFIGILNMVPYLQLVSIIPATLLCLVYAVGGGGNFWSIFSECIAVYCIVQCIQDLFLTPKIMGKAMGLNPALILLSLSVWGSLLGFMGLIIALPLTTLLMAYYDRYVIKCDDSEGDSDDGPTDVKEINEALQSPLSEQ